VGKLTEYGEPINHVLEVNIDSEDVIFELYELPPLSFTPWGDGVRLSVAAQWS
jgi:hypothetical protein